MVTFRRNVSKVTVAASSIYEYLYSLIAAEIESIVRWYDKSFFVKNSFATHSWLLNSLQAGLKEGQPQEIDKSDLPDLSEEYGRRHALILNGDLNHSTDIQGLLDELSPRLSRTSRLLVVTYNPYYCWIFALANRFGLRSSPAPTSFPTRSALENVAKLCRFEVVRIRPAGYFPFRLLGLGDAVNRWMAIIPLFRWLALFSVVVLRPIKPESKRLPSLSVLVAARNEKGNMRALLSRLPEICPDMELIVVEGHSNDGTWEELRHEIANHNRPFRILAAQQKGVGKVDAIRLAAEMATKDLMVILDADLTVPPEDLARFYKAYCDGLGDFINGSRLVYPMEKHAMFFLNWLGNIFFAKSLSIVLDSGITDSLCGTKLFSKTDYARMIAWRKSFGDFDPFGDFELLFPASQMALGLCDLPVRYLARTYGSTNISRFRHGYMLLRMTLIGLNNITSGKTK